MIPGFSKRLLRWDKAGNTRSMPWKGEKDPYKIWLSEIILQQTRVEQGRKYYEKFIEVFPTIHQLANAPVKKVFKLWEGLGYYNRCRNLIETAKRISKQFNGQFPSSYEQIIQLKGIGSYTAAAIASFAFDLPYAVVDGNVQRVLARYFGITTPIDTNTGKKFYAELAGSLLDRKHPGLYNQAIMDFGAIICKPQRPLCNQCIQAKDCVAGQNNWISILPVKEKSIQRKNRWFYYFIIENEKEEVYIRQRKEKDIWRNLYEFVLWETGFPIVQPEKPAAEFLRKVLGKNKFIVTGISKMYKQQLTHQTIQGIFLKIRIYGVVPELKEYELVKKKKLKNYPFPKFINVHLQIPSPLKPPVSGT
jgi:A/G-specific adenine glycosylase